MPRTRSLKNRRRNKRRVENPLQRRVETLETCTTPLGSPSVKYRASLPRLLRSGMRASPPYPRYGGLARIPLRSSRGNEALYFTLGLPSGVVQVSNVSTLLCSGFSTLRLFRRLFFNERVRGMAVKNFGRLH